MTSSKDIFGVLTTSSPIVAYHKRAIITHNLYILNPFKIPALCRIISFQERLLI